MRKKQVKILLLAVCLSFSTIVFAETVVFKGGEAGEGAIVEITEQTLPATEENVSTVIPNEDPVLISQRINDAYYNLQKQGLQELRCEVLSSIFDQTKSMINTQYSLTDKETKVLDSIKFYLTIDQKGKGGFDSTPYTPTGNQKFDKAVQQGISYTENELRSFYEIWKDYSIEPKFKENDVIYAIEKLSDGYDISYKEKKSKVSKKMTIGSNFCISQETNTYDGNSINTIIPSFVKSNQGLLLQGYESDMNNGAFKSVVTIEYQEVEGLQIPNQATIQHIRSRVKQKVELRFLILEVKKVEEQ